MACACQKGKKNATSYTVTQSNGTVVGSYRSESEAQAAARRFPGSVIRSSVPAS